MSQFYSNVSLAVGFFFLVRNGAVELYLDNRRTSAIVPTMA
jgi:uncharacterized membrane protein YphA (DoxX/SURF4 family)